MAIITVSEYFKLPKKDKKGAMLLMTNGDEWKIERISNQFPPALSNEYQNKYLITVKGTIVCRTGDEEIILTSEN
jgi:hypothetical protein